MYFKTVTNEESTRNFRSTSLHLTRPSFFPHFIILINIAGHPPHITQTDTHTESRPIKYQRMRVRVQVRPE